MASPAAISAANQHKWNRLQESFQRVLPLVNSRTDFSDAALATVTSALDTLRNRVNLVAAVPALTSQLEEFFSGPFRTLLDGFRGLVDGAPKTKDPEFENFVLYFSRVGKIIDTLTERNESAEVAFGGVLRTVGLEMVDYYQTFRPEPTEIDWLWAYNDRFRVTLDRYYRELERGDSGPSSSAHQTLSTSEYNHNQDKSSDDDDGADSGTHYYEN